MNLIELLKKRIIIGDGALGTMLHAAGAGSGELPESLNIHKAELVQDIHYRYYMSGSDFVSTNTFGANRLKLEPKGYTVSQIVEAAVENARKAADAARAARARADAAPAQAAVRADAASAQATARADAASAQATARADAAPAQVAARGADTTCAAADAIDGRESSCYLVAHSIGPIGKLLTPMGELSFEDAYDIFKEQICVGDAAGVDFILFETFTDIFELKTAVLAAVENSKLPVVCSVTFQENGRMLSGTDPITAVHILQDMGIAAIGVNCSTGPIQMFDIVMDLLAHAHVPVLIQPNAGIPDEEEGKAIYNVGTESFSESMESFIESGAAIVGGCCGTTPDYIASLYRLLCRKGFKRRRDRRSETNYSFDSGSESEKLEAASMSDREGVEKKRSRRDERFDKIVAADLSAATVCSASKTVFFGHRVRVIGERINPTGKQALKQALIDKDYAFIEDEAVAQIRAGAELLEVNMGLPDIDEEEMLADCVSRLECIIDAPLVIDCSHGHMVEKAVRASRGKPMINSVSGEVRKMHEIFPIVKKYGVAVIALTLDENGIPDSVEDRLAILDKIIAVAATYGINRRRIIVDCLTLTVSAQQDACVKTLEAMRRVKETYGMYTTLGVSNISYGLPERSMLNRSFLSMALLAGLDAPIIDPTNPAYMEAVYSAEVLLGRDAGAEQYIQRMTKRHIDKNDNNSFDMPNTRRLGRMLSFHGEMSLEEIIIHGFDSRAAATAEKLLLTVSPMDIIEKIVMRALERVGRDYEKGSVFLPQMIKSAEAAKNALAVLRSDLKARGESLSYGRVILATVKDDIHDIGKNIVKSILENYGYDIIDLGKDVSPEVIIKTAKEEDIKLIGLSALMTTTVANMSKTIAMLKSEGLDCVVMVGGAVLNADYAKKIGADYYGANAMDAVTFANEIFQK